MSGLILGPPGVLPPGEWAEGVRVWTRADRGGLVRRAGGGVVTGVYASHAGGVAVGVHLLDGRPLDWVHLDITRGCLSHACRALLHLVAPEVAQPDCAPVLLPAPSPSGWAEWCLYLPGNSVTPAWRSDVTWQATTNPRRALSLALHAAAGVAP